jgi:hypothetical protein
LTADCNHQVPDFDTNALQVPAKDCCGADF